MNRPLIAAAGISLGTEDIVMQKMVKVSELRKPKFSSGEESTVNK